MFCLLDEKRNFFKIARTTIVAVTQSFDLNSTCAQCCLLVICTGHWNLLAHFWLISNLIKKHCTNLKADHYSFFFLICYTLPWNDRVLYPDIVNSMQREKICIKPATQQFGICSSGGRVNCLMIEIMAILSPILSESVVEWVTLATLLSIDMIEGLVMGGWAACCGLAVMFGARGGAPCSSVCVVQAVCVCVVSRT